MNVCLSFFKIIVFVSGILMSASSIAASVDWNLKFFDETEQLVGNGNFSYDPSTTRCVEVRSPVGCGPPDITDGIVISNFITSLSITFDQRNYVTTRDSAFWWNEPSRGGTTGSIISGGRDGPQGITSSWLFNDFFHLHNFRRSFEMSNFTEISEGLLWTGSWTGFEYDEQFSFDPSFVGRGTFMVIKTPIPTSVWLFISGFAFLFRRNKRVSMSLRDVHDITSLRLRK